jgi:phytoene desaturase
MGPSWYWMPDVFDRFFADFEKKQLITELIKLSPHTEFILVLMGLIHS